MGNDDYDHTLSKSGPICRPVSVVITKTGHAYRVKHGVWGKGDQSFLYHSC